MPRTSLSEQIKSHEKKKARVALREQELREQTRKALFRQIVAAGGLVEKAGLLELSPEALLGALLEIEKGAGDQATIARWEAAGRARLAFEEAEKTKKRQAVVITFPQGEKITRSTFLALKTAGFKYLKEYDVWLGTSTLDEAEALGAVHRGRARLAPGLEALVAIAAD